MDEGMSRSNAVHIRHLFVSHGHNFFFHHGGPPGQHPIEERDEIACVAGRGIEGDRFFDYRSDYKGQITFCDVAVFRELCAAVGATDAAPSAMRRNVMVEGADLNALIGRRFSLQGVLFEGAEECRPCEWMNLAVGPGAEERLRGRGGLRARILSSGTLRRGPAELVLVSSEPP
jgi:MOSC domain-containing protein YiiM